MSRLPRRIFDVLTACSVLLCAASLLIGVQTWRTPYCMARQNGGAVESARFERGRFTRRRIPDYPTRMEGLGPDWKPIPCEPEPTRRRGEGWPVALGFGRARSEEFIEPAGVAAPGDHFSPLTYSLVEQWMPLWPVALAGAVLPTARLAAYLRRRRRRRGNRCPACGYDLRASRQSARCPECGAPIVHPTPADAATPERGV